MLQMNFVNSNGQIDRQEQREVESAKERGEIYIYIYVISIYRQRRPYRQLERKRDTNEKREGARDKRKQRNRRPGSGRIDRNTESSASERDRK